MVKKENSMKNNEINKFDTKIFQYNFEPSSINKIKANSKGVNWPTVYILSNEKEAYIGETLSAEKRMEQHLKNNKRKKLSKINLIINDSFNKSAILDIENMLIEYFHAENKYTLQNENFGQSKMHNYYQRGFYQECFYDIWNKLRMRKLVKKSAYQIQNSNIFKFSPYKQLTDDQFDIMVKLLKDISKSIDSINGNSGEESILINGVAGTGKTIMAICLIKFLVDLIKKPIDYTNTEEFLDEENLYSNFSVNKNIKEYAQKYGLSIGFVIPVPSFRATIKNVFSITKGLKSNMVISPSQAAKGNYDILIVDEAHRLKRRKKLTNYVSHDKINKLLGMNNDATELDWVLKKSKLLTILFYDKNQSVKVSDVERLKFINLESNSKIYNLSNQLRIKGGQNYIDYINKLLGNSLSSEENLTMKDYDFRIFDDLEEMFEKIREKNTQYNGLCRMLCGYSFPWRHHIRDNSNTIYEKTYDFKIDGHEYIWNTTDSRWLTKNESINEIGCVYTCQGYDLNYAGVILGSDIFFNTSTGKIDFNIDKYCDTYSKDINDIEQTKKNIINAYLVLLTRGIYGTYVYACDKKLNEYLKEKFKTQ